MSSVVLNSIENLNGDRCLDVFERDDGTFGFEEFRKEPESKTGWVLVGYYSDGMYKTQGLAFLEAGKRVSWLNEVLKK
ncbi:MAG: hypothetical protein VX780_01385 [Pseudomonadota bacterium]|nr:hypothetical protein [Pseudomonadota bacterium]